MQTEPIDFAVTELALEREAHAPRGAIRETRRRTLEAGAAAVLDPTGAAPLPATIAGVAFRIPQIDHPLVYLRDDLDPQAEWKALRDLARGLRTSIVAVAKCARS